MRNILKVLGRSEFLLADLVSARRQTLHLPLMKDNGKCAKKDCAVTIQGEEIVKKTVKPVTNAPTLEIVYLGTLTMSIRAGNLDKKDFFGKSDPL
jgi:hypothetical protein